MRASVITDGLESLKNGEALTAKQVIKWIFESLELPPSISDLNVDSTGRIDRDFSWNEFNKKTAHLVFPLELPGDKEELKKMIKAIGDIFSATIERDNALLCWSQISGILVEMQSKCTNGIFMLISARISVSLIKKFLDFDAFDTNHSCLSTMLRFWQCGVKLVHKVNDRKTPKANKSLHTEFINCMDEFLDLVGANKIFVSEAFYVRTKNLLENVAKYPDDTTLSKYLNVISTALTYPIPEVHNMFLYCTAELQTLHFVLLAVRKKINKTIVPEEERRLSLDILYKLLKYSRNANIRFNCNWTRVFACTLFGFNGTFSDVAREAFLLEAERSEDNGPATELTRLEKAVKAFCLFNDGQYDCHNVIRGQEPIGAFVDMFQDYENFVTCEKLFVMLRTHAADNPGMCIATIEIIECAALRMVKDERLKQHYSNIMKEVIRHVEYVKTYPRLLYRLINIVNFNVVQQDDRLRNDILSIVEPVIEALSLHCHYGTAIGLFDILKRCNIDCRKIEEIVESFVAKIVQRNSDKHFPMVLLALNDTFGLFCRIDPNNLSLLYKCLKRQFQLAAGGKLKAMYVALIMNMLSAYQSSADIIPDMPSAIIENEARFYYDRYIRTHIKTVHSEIRENLFTSMMWGMALCIYYTAFDTPRSWLMWGSFDALAIASNSYSPSYVEEASQVETMDLDFITKYYRCVTSFYERPVPCSANPEMIFECYRLSDFRFKHLVEELILKVLRQEGGRYQTIADSIVGSVTNIKPPKNVKPFVRKLLVFIGTNPEFDVSAVALKVFHSIVQHVVEKKTIRPKTVVDIQDYLYRNYIKDDSSRSAALNSVQHQINSLNENDRRVFEMILERVQSVSNANNRGKKTHGRKRPQEQVDDEDESDNDLPSPPQQRRSNSLASVRQSLRL